MLPHHVAAVFCTCREPLAEPAEEDRRSNPPTLQLLQPPVAVATQDQIQAPDGPARAMGARDPPAGFQEPPAPVDAVAGQHPTPTMAIASPRRSPRILQAYDGMRLGSVERASKRKAAAASSGSSSGSNNSRRSGGRKKAKMTKVRPVADVLELPLQQTPRPLTRGKLRQLAKCCDLNAEAIIAQASSSLDNNPAVEERRPLTPLEVTMRKFAAAKAEQLILWQTAMWRRRAKIRYCVFGDENSRFFHAMANCHSRRNKIRLLVSDGIEHYDNKSKLQIATRYFKDLLGQPSPSLPVIQLNTIY